MSRLVVIRDPWWALGVEQVDPPEDPTLLHAFLLTTKQAHHNDTVWGSPAMCGQLRQEGARAPRRTMGQASGENVCSPCVDPSVEWVLLSNELEVLEARIKVVRKRRTQLRNGPTVCDRLLEAMDTVTPRRAAALAKQINHPVASVRAFISNMVKEGRVLKHGQGFTRPEGVR